MREESQNKVRVPGVEAMGGKGKQNPREASQPHRHTSLPDDLPS